MRKRIIAVVIACGAMLSTSYADVDQKLVTSSGCVACHTQSQKLIGPSYDEIYEKYKNDNNATAVLIDRVSNGSSGVWGGIPMTPNSHLPKEDIEILVLEILKKK